MSSLFDKVYKGAHHLGGQLKEKLAVLEKHSHTHDDGECHPGAHEAYQDNRFMSFAPERREGNDAKWYVDACGYMWAVSKALESAKETIWIMDCGSKNSIL